MCGSHALSSSDKSVHSHISEICNSFRGLCNGLRGRHDTAILSDRNENQTWQRHRDPSMRLSLSSRSLSAIVDFTKFVRDLRVRVSQGLSQKQTKKQKKPLSAIVEVMFREREGHRRKVGRDVRDSCSTATEHIDIVRSQQR